ncbi:arsenate reductase family protein [Ulvibacterium marinum]|uniref:Arsenate reductase n=1 Tax=Ulvibacterium marinum TaxID=2419782 RepID=A0A3B0C1U9_9FLAO|nr:hypothetical protein [Ulvibacterium marinum]RKN78728.1 hypothetical protein D7Z94_21275 [Ulvibacterium marinum]
MGIIASNDNEIKLYYSGKTSLGKQTYAYVSASAKKVLGIDVSKTKVTGSQWAEIAAGLNIPVGDLINTEHPDFIKSYGEEKIDLDEHDWLRVLEKHPETLAYPVMISGDVFRVLKTPSDFVKYMEPDSTAKDVRQD